MRRPSLHRESGNDALRRFAQVVAAQVEHRRIRIGPLEVRAQQFEREARQRRNEGAACLHPLAGQRPVGTVFAGPAQGAKLGAVAQPLRAALTGRSTSPGIFDVLAVLGREESLGRIKDQASAETLLPIGRS